MNLAGYFFSFLVRNQVHPNQGTMKENSLCNCEVKAALVSQKHCALKQEQQA